MAPYEQLAAWQLCHQLALEIYRATVILPKSELYGITAQTRRAAFSAAANIAEGAAKRGPRELRRYLDIAIGSLGELEYWLRVLQDLAMLPEDTLAGLSRLHAESCRTTWGLYRAVSRRSASLAA